MKIFLKILFFSLLMMQISFAQWVQTNGPYGGTVHELFVSGTNIFAGTQNSVFLSTNNGSYWYEVNTGLTNKSVSAFAEIGTNLFVGTGSGVFNSTNNGTSWTQAGLTDSSIYCLAVSGRNLFAATGSWVSGSYNIFLSTNNGTSWKEVDSGLSGREVTSLAVIGTNIFAGTYGGGVFLSTNNGTSWKEVNSGLTENYIICMTVSGTKLFVGTGFWGYGSIFLTTNNGTSWTEVNSGLPISVSVSSIAVSDTNLFASTSPMGGTFLSTNNGTNWTLVSSIQFSCFAVSGTNLYAGNGDGVLLSTDNGTSWTKLSNGLSNTYVHCFAVSPNGAGNTNLFVGTSSNSVGVFLSTNDGINWSEANYGLNNTMIFCLALSSNETDETNLFAGTNNGVFYSNNNGTNWSSIGLTEQSVRAIVVSDSILIAGTYGNGVFRSTNKGTNWIEAGLKNYIGPTFVIFPNGAGGTNLLAGTSGGAVFISTNNGTNWTMVSSGLPSIQVLAGSPNGISGTNLFAGTRKGVYLSTNNGISWAAIGLTNYIISSFTISDKYLFAGVNGNVFLSTDKGIKWTEVNSGLENIQVNALAVSGNYLFAGTEGSSVWRRPLYELVPVELNSFTASANGKEVTLNWTTATELNNQGFEVQRKFGGNGFVTIGSVKGHGTTTSPNNYTYVDELTDAGKYFYRLKQIDFGGKYEYSQTVEVNWSPFTTYKLEQNYPNPFNPSTKISWQSPVSSWQTLKVYDVLGNEVATLVNEYKPAGSYEVDFDASDLPCGVYFYQIKAGEYKNTKKMLLLK